MFPSINSVDLVIASACLASSLFLYTSPHHEPKCSTRPRAYILQNKVTHSRLLPKKTSHAFTYPTIALFLSLDALEHHSLDLGGGFIFGYGGLWGRLTGVRPDPYLTSHRAGQTIREKLEAVLVEQGYLRDLDIQSESSNHQCVFEDAWMLTMPSLCGFEGINPLTVYFCYKLGRPWLVVLEVHNTFGESHVYLLEISKNEDAKPARGYDHQWTFRREFHVSPFNDRSGFYKVSVKLPSHAPTPEPIMTSSEYVSFPKPIVRIHLHAPSEPNTPRPIPGPLKLTALLRPVQSTPLTATALLSALAKAPFTLFLSMARILYHAWILHYIQRLDVFIRPEPLPSSSFRENSGLKNDSMEQQTGGGVKWLPSNPLEAFARRRLLDFLQRRVEETGLTVELLAADPAIPNIKMEPKTNTNGNATSQSCLIISYLSPKFFTILFLCPSPSHALLLGSKTEKIFNVSSTDLFLTLFDSSTASRSTPSACQRLRAAVIPRPIPYDTPTAHSLDLSVSGIRSIWRSFPSYLVICTLVFLERLEAWIFWLSCARLVPGDEPWKQWERAEKVLQILTSDRALEQDSRRKVLFGSALHDEQES